VDAALCARLENHLQSQIGLDLGVMDVTKSSQGAVAITQSDNRVTTELDVMAVQGELDDLVSRACSDIIPQRYTSEVEWFERPKVLSYREGGLYASHADSEQHDPKTDSWTRVLDRDISLILYLNDQFDGGFLDFHFFNYRYTPRAGDLVMFPSDHRYVHEATKVTAGHRLAVVSWLALQGTDRVRDRPPKNVRKP